MDVEERLGESGHVAALPDEDVRPVDHKPGQADRREEGTGASDGGLREQRDARL
ncbi:hypothetical protein [Actinomadura sp. NPDC048394]|uniref:hypothetical protein n=1 Tax=Actinomadura sp. NPDC048394 TaxID=3158223 RepID=UPI00340E3B32